MSDTVKQFPLKPHQPKCMKCSHEPLRFSHNTMTLETGAVISIIWCLDCGATLNIAQVGQRETQILAPGGLVRPV